MKRSQDNSLPAFVDLDLDDIPQRDSDTEISLEINSDDCRLSGAASQGRKERDKASKSLEKYKSHPISTSTSYRYLRPSEALKVSTEIVLPENTSTPKDFNFMKNSNLGVFDVVVNCDINEKLAEDEKSWIRQMDFPAEMQEFSVDFFQEDNVSMGAFFKERSDDPKFLAKSPAKSFASIALIGTSAANFCPSPGTRSKSLEKPLEDLERTEENFTEAIEENISPDCHSVKSTLYALTSLPGGELPIATTKTEIIWGCIKPGKSVSQGFVLRNCSSSPIGIQCTVTNLSFHLNENASEHNLVLDPYERRALNITFAPTTTGASVDNLNITSTDPAYKESVKRFIRLYGYGGYGNVTIHKIIKDIAGKFLLSLGNIDEGREMRQTFVIKNCGSLATFTYFDFIANGLYLFSSNIEISPKIVVLLPEEEKEVTVNCNLHKKDFSYIKTKINSCVIDFGKLKVFHGTEVDRARLRKMGQKAGENQEIDPFVLNLIDKFPGEVVPSDLRLFQESVKSMEEILECFKYDEIVVTFEQGIDRTLPKHLLEDETAMYQSLREDTVPDFLKSSISREAYHIEPTRIILTPPAKMRDKIFVTNNNKTIHSFEIHCQPEGLHLRPRNGTIRPGETLIIELHYIEQCTDKTVFKVKILVGNENLEVLDIESFEVDVKVVFVGDRLH